MRIDTRRPYLCPHCRKSSQWERRRGALAGGVAGIGGAVLVNVLVMWLGYSKPLPASVLGGLVFIITFLVVSWVFGRLSPLYESQTTHVA